ncbi:hypothetical protein ACSBR1_039421 [Camellia fascicularis]
MVVRLSNYYSCPRFIAPTIKPLSSISSLHTRKTTPLFPFGTVSLSIFAFKRSRELGSSSVYIERERKVEERESPMTITPAVRISDRKLVVKDRTILTDLPDNVLATSGSSSGPVEGVFLGAVLEEEKSRHVVSLGRLRDVRFLACFRFKLWWMAQRMGDQGREIPLETQFLLLETKDGSHLESDGGNQNDQIVYTVFLPLIEGPFRACLQGNDARDELELCLESGDCETTSSVFTHSVYVSAGTDPFVTITDAITAVKSHLNTFRQRHEKKLPGIVDYFGWCTWDAFYQEVTQEGVEAGLSSLASGGSPPKFVIIDDGWQSVGGDKQAQPSDQAPLLRLTAIKENAKFKNKEDPGMGIENIVRIAKEKHGLRYVYVWHAITGYWGGVRPGEAEMEEYESLMKYPKVDAQCILETLGGGLGGRVELTRMYHQALDASVASHFPDNGIIACMSQNTDALYCSKQTAVVRASDDFYPRDPVSHTIHIAAVAYNTVFVGEFMLPDWDMFHSLHPAAEYHASARAISGGPVYVSDAPGKHNFDLLKKLVLPDGSILRAQLPGRPTKDCLFSDPARDGVSLLKIWSMNKYTGVLGVYNCQGAAWNTIERKNTFHQTGSEAITGLVRGCDVHLIGDVAMDPEWNGDSAIYSHRGELFTLPYNAAMPISLKVLEHDIFTVTPIKVLAPGFNFAPLGLIDMFNAGGAIEALKYEVKGGAQLCELEDGYRGEGNELAGERVENLSGELVAMVRMEVKGCGRFGAYSSVKPRKCTVGLSMVEFEYDSVSGLVTLSLDHMPEEDKKFHIVEVEL